MSMPHEPIVLLPVNDHRDEPGPGFLDRIRAAVGHRRLTFPCLGADPKGLDGVLVTSQGGTGRIMVNGHVVKPMWRQDGRALFDPRPFCQWENVVSVRGDARALRLAPVVDRDKTGEGFELPPGTSWRLQTMAGTDLGEMTQAPRPADPAASVMHGLAKGLAAMVAGNGDVWSFYDLKTGSYRLPGWRWDTGIVLEALAAGAQYLGDPGLSRVAVAVGNRLLETQLDHPECPGGFPEWTDPRYSESKQIVSQWVAPFNAAFIAVGLARLTRLTGHPGYLLAGRRSLSLVAKLGLSQTGGLSGYYFERSRQWRYLGQINDSGILGRGLALFPEIAWARNAAQLASGYILDKAAREDGHIGRAWWDPAPGVRTGQPLFPEWKSDPRRVVPKIFWRGQAWVLMGLSGALRLGAGEKQAAAAGLLAEFILNGQLPDGSWLYSGLEQQLGSCAKTTAALALALAEWSKISGDTAVLPAVCRALDFLKSCRDPETVPPELSGLPVDGSKEGCIIYFRDRPVVCAYAGALELLARLEMGEGR